MISIERLKCHMKYMGDIGYTEGLGITRLPFTSTYEQGITYISSLLEGIGINPYRDAVGNLFGVLPGVKKPSIMLGSHIDTVPNGGMFDGSLGVLAAIECVQTLIVNGYKNRHPLEIVVFIAEEGGSLGGTFGSRCVTGSIDPYELQEELSKEGLNAKDVLHSRRKEESIHCYLELHIEQGGTLDALGIPVGIVNGITSIARYWIKVTGQANHAGTTPMSLRDDALVKACQIILDINRLVNDYGHGLVGTVGNIHVQPGGINVIPGVVAFPLELRAPKMSTIKQFMASFPLSSSNIAITHLDYKKGRLMSSPMSAHIEKACQLLGYAYNHMYSGAGHDANEMASITDVGVIFVPSLGGISHSPLEYTCWSDVEKGANTLLHTLLNIDQ